MKSENFLSLRFLLARCENLSQRTVTFSIFDNRSRRLSSIEKMDARIYRPREVSPEDTGVRFRTGKPMVSSKVWPLRRGVCEFCVKYTMRTREQRIAPSDDPPAEYRSFSRHKNIVTVPKVSTTITSTWKHGLLVVKIILIHRSHVPSTTTEINNFDV